MIVPLALIADSELVGLITNAPESRGPGSFSGIWKTMVEPGWPFAALIASRNEPAPLSFVLVTVKVAAG